MDEGFFTRLDVVEPPYSRTAGEGTKQRPYLGTAAA
jgi:hypothetical protein